MSDIMSRSRAVAPGDGPRLRAWARPTPRLAGCALVLSLAAGAPARAQDAAAWTPPRVTNQRYDEDWSSLAAPGAGEGRWTEPFKYRTLDDASRTYVSTGLELRLRTESFSNNFWGGSAAPDDGYLWVRAVPHVDVHAGAARVFLQPIIAYASGVAPSVGPIDETRADLLQGFAEVSAPVGEAATLTVRAGRQMLSLGSERLVATRYGPNVPRAFDGVRGDIGGPQGVVSVFWSRPVQPALHAFDDRASRTEALWGAYASGRGLDVYYLGYRDKAARLATAAGLEERHSIGARSFGRHGDWQWNVEATGQFGRFDGQQIRAWMLSSEVSRNFPDAPLTPDIRLRTNIASGDHDPADGRIQTFNALYPKGKTFGELTPVGPYNVVHLNPQVGFNLRPDLTLSLGGMAYWRQARGDGIYDIPGNLVRTPDGVHSRFIGAMAETIVEWQASPEFVLSTSASVFAPGRFIKETGPARTILMLGVEAQFRF